jgi:hypothetical protein
MTPDLVEPIRRCLDAGKSTEDKSPTPSPVIVTVILMLLALSRTPRTRRSSGTPRLRARWVLSCFEGTHTCAATEKEDMVLSVQNLDGATSLFASSRVLVLVARSLLDRTGGGSCLRDRVDRRDMDTLKRSVHDK